MHLETHNTCHFEPGPDGKPVYVVTNEPRLEEISQELEVIRTERAKILDKIARLEQILGEGALEVPTGYENFDLVGRKKMEAVDVFHS